MAKPWSIIWPLGRERAVRPGCVALYIACHDTSALGASSSVRLIKVLYVVLVAVLG